MSEYKVILSVCMRTQIKIRSVGEMCDGKQDGVCVCARAGVTLLGLLAVFDVTG